MVEGVDVKCVRDAQAACAEMQGLRDGTSSLILVDVPFSEDGSTLLCDMSTGTNRPVLPLSVRRQVFDVVHGLAHPGVRATRRLMQARYIWKGMAHDVGEWVRQCVACQKAKVYRHIAAPLQEFQTPDERFSHIHVDVVGPLPVSRGCTYLFTVIDRFTCWPEAIPVAETSTVSLARVLISAWISRFGVPVRITSDRGAQFTSQLWADMSEILGIRLSMTTAYHPQANGLVERLHRRLKDALKARLGGPDWCDQLPWVLLGLRTEPKVDLDASVAELVYGAPISIPGELVPEVGKDENVAARLRHLRSVVGGLRPAPTTTHGGKKSTFPGGLLEARFVFVRRGAHAAPLQPPYDGPFKVVHAGPKVFRLQMGSKEETVSVDRIKVAHLDPGVDPPVVVPPRRGRPPLQRPNVPLPLIPVPIPPRPATTIATHGGRPDRGPRFSRAGRLCKRTVRYGVG